MTIECMERNPSGILFYFIQKRACISCKNTKNDIGEHFADVSKMIVLCSEAKQKIEDGRTAPFGSTSKSKKVNQ